MDGLTVTCRTCGIKTSFEDAGNHVCGSRQQQSYVGGYEDRAPRRSNDSSISRRMQSNRSESVSSSMSYRDQYPPRKPLPKYPENEKPRDELSLGPAFDLGSLRAPHSYNGPYGSLPGRPGSRGVGSPPPPLSQRRGPGGPGPRPPMQRNPYDSPRNGPVYDQNPPRQQLPPPRQRVVDDHDYARRDFPPPRTNSQQDPRYPPPNRPYTPNNGPRMNGPPMNVPDQYQRMSPERRQPEPNPQPQYQDPNPYGRQSQDNYDRGYGRPDLRRNPSSDPDQLPQSTSTNSLNGRSLEPPVEEPELWRQIRSRAGQTAGSISSSRSSGSDDLRSRRSEDTPPSSAASPISPSKETGYPAPLGLPSKPSADKFKKSEHTREISEVSTKVNMPVCRACDEPIRGRSLASQDGKLSGRYHKRCFCCTTCQKPFETASFYVFKDRPYCKRHYHELNHSTCGECGEGVEGQCLQLEDCTIRHPTCLTCTTCQIQLDEDYFEAKGLPYCDRHARSLGKKDIRMERRKTRLLVM